MKFTAQEFAEKLKASPLPDEEKNAIIENMRAGTYLMEEVEDIYNILIKIECLMSEGEKECNEKIKETLNYLIKIRKHTNE